MDQGSKRGSLGRILGISCVGFFFLLMAVLYVRASERLLEIPLLLAGLNTVFLCALPLGIAWLSAKSHQSTGTTGFLLMGCGLVFFGLSSLFAGWVMPLARGPNPTVTLHNLGSLLAGACEVSGAQLFMLDVMGIKKPARRLPGFPWLYGAILAAVSLVAFLAFRGLLPVFFDPSSGPSLLRQVVLGSAILAFFLAGCIFLEIYIVARTEFAYWYGLALWLITLGLSGVLVQPGVGSLMGWAGRSAQYAGGVFLVIAFFQGKGEIAAAGRTDAARTAGILWPFLENKVEARTNSLTTITEALKAEIAERTIAEKALGESEAFLEAIIEKSPSSMWISDSSGTLIRLNQACRDTLRISDDDVVGRYNILKDNIIRESGNMGFVEEVFSKGRPARFSLEYDTTALEGIELGRSTKLMLEVCISPILDQYGRVVNAVVQHIDVSGIAQAKQRVEQLAQELGVILETATIGISRVQGRRVVWANAAYDETFGYARSESIGAMTSRFHLDPEDFEAFGKNAYPVLATGAPYSVEKLMRKKDGSTFWCSITGRSIQAGNASLGSIWMSSDITERKVVEEELQRVMEGKRNLHRELQHRAKNSFNMILGMIGIEMRENSSTETTAVLEELSLRVSAVAGLYTLLYASGSAEKVRLDDYCRKVIEALEVLSRGISIHVDFEGLDIQVSKAAPLGLILTEMLTNAFKYAFPAGSPGSVIISLRRGQGGGELSISDDGVGFPAGFDPTASPGTGLCSSTAWLARSAES